MTEKEIENLTNEGSEILKHLKSTMKEEIKLELESYKRNMSNRDTWCCNNMKSFMNKAYHINSPIQTNSPYQTTYSLYCSDIVYCPFCGIKL